MGVLKNQDHLIVQLDQLSLQLTPGIYFLTHIQGYQGLFKTSSFLHI